MSSPKSTSLFSSINPNLEQPEYSPLQPGTNIQSHNHSNSSTPEKQSNVNTFFLPDMSIILRYFGIEPSHFRTVPLKEYQWNTFEVVEDLDNPTISQKIKSRSGGARKREENH